MDGPIVIVLEPAALLGIALIAVIVWTLWANRDETDRPANSSPSSPSPVPDPAPLAQPAATSRSTYVDSSAPQPTITQGASVAQPRQAIPAPPIAPANPATIQPAPEPTASAARPPIDDLARSVEQSQKLAERPAAAKVRTAVDYKRHSGIPGFLYIARNDEYREHVYKLGYTTVDPRHRAKRLSQQVVASGDIGNFRVVHSVWVTASYDTEQALFDALSARRIATGREFFYADEPTLFMAMEAASSLCRGSTAALQDFLDSDPWKRSPSMHTPKPRPYAMQPPLPDTQGWAIACSNPWHRADTFRIAFTTGTPDAFLRRLNSPQRARTSQVGFFEPVLCESVRQLAGVRRALSQSLEPYRVQGRRSFVRLDQEILRAAFEAADVPATAAEAAPTPRTAGKRPSMGSPVQDEVCRSHWVKPVVANPSPDASSAKRATPCVHCDQLLVFTDPIGTNSAAACPACGGLFTCFIGKAAVTTGFYC